MSGTETADSPQVKLTRSLIGSMTTKDIDFFHKFLHKDFRRVTYPKSISRPEYDKEGWIQQIAELFTIWPEGGGETTYHSIIETPGTVIAHSTSKIKTTIGVEMIREMITFTQIITDEDGSLKIKQLDEFTDSKAYLDFFKSVAEAKANRKHSASHAA